MTGNQTYTTSKIAEKFGLHSNTIRLYESWGLISAPQRQSNGYRVFTEEHIKQIEIVRLALKAEVLQNGLRKQAIDIIKAVAQREQTQAEVLTDNYITNITNEIALSEEAMDIIDGILKDKPIELGSQTYKRQQAAESLHITPDSLRNWELNGLLKVKRKENGYRIYNESDMQILKVIRELRVANYSISAILRMLNALNQNHSADIKQVLNTPDDGEYIVSVCDKLLTSLNALLKDAKALKLLIKEL